MRTLGEEWVIDFLLFFIIFIWPVLMGEREQITISRWDNGETSGGVCSRPLDGNRWTGREDGKEVEKRDVDLGRRLKG